jgi:alcohol dehydrogenase
MPTAQHGEAVIRLVKAGVSATDLELLKGLLNFRGVMGNQFVGVVESTDGHQASNLSGKRVVGSIATICGKCDMCIAGLSAHCRNRTIMGLHGRDGCLAERFTLPLRNLLPIPDGLDDDHAVFAGELAGALQAAAQLTIVNKPYITILGDGSLGLLTAQVMAKLNASVRLVGRQPEKLAICEKWGIKHRHADEVGRRADQDIVVDCTGSPDGLRLAMELVRPRGKIVLKSLYALPTKNASPVGVFKESGRRATGCPESSDPGRGLDLAPIVLNEIELIGSFCGRLNEALSVLARREIDVVSLISKRMSLSDGATILTAAARPDIVKVLVDA